MMTTTRTNPFQQCDGFDRDPKGRSIGPLDLDLYIEIPEKWSVTIIAAREGVMLLVRRPGEGGRPSLSSMMRGSPLQGTYLTRYFASWDAIEAFSYDEETTGITSVRCLAQDLVRGLLPGGLSFI
jgi:hypothetical protein